MSGGSGWASAPLIHRLYYLNKGPDPVQTNSLGLKAMVPTTIVFSQLGLLAVVGYGLVGYRRLFPAYLGYQGSPSGAPPAAKCLTATKSLSVNVLSATFCPTAYPALHMYPVPFV